MLCKSIHFQNFIQQPISVNLISNSFFCLPIRQLKLKRLNKKPHQKKQFSIEIENWFLQIHSNMQLLNRNEKNKWEKSSPA